MLGALVLVLLAPSVWSHGNMMWPPSWFDPRGEIGLSPGGFMQGGPPGGEDPAIMWFTNWTFIPDEQEATLPAALSTIPDFHGGAASVWDRVNCFLMDEYGYDYDICRAWYPVDPARNPWMAPGTAPVFSPCGWQGGNPEGCGGVPAGEECPGGGTSQGVDARHVDWEEVVTTEWRRGGMAEVGWGMIANHGGGYSYRLCKLGDGLVTEECFQRTPLHFASAHSWVQYGWDPATRVELLASRTREGTFPPGSQWTMNPIPVCNSTAMGWIDPTCPNGFEFEPPGPGLHGTGEHVATGGYPDFPWTLMDEVEVPADLEAGDYVLSFRWDCEATPQIWNACSNIRIV